MNLHLAPRNVGGVAEEGQPEVFNVSVDKCLVSDAGGIAISVSAVSARRETPTHFEYTSVELVTSSVAHIRIREIDSEAPQAGHSSSKLLRAPETRD